MAHLLGDGSAWARIRQFVRGVIAPPRRRRASRARFHVIGHRGAGTLAPENTTWAFQAALDEGANAIETDLCVTRDGHVVLWHDRDPNAPVALARQTGLDPFLYIPDVPRVGTAERRPVHEQTLDEFMHHHGYSLRRDLPRHFFETNEVPRIRPQTVEELFAWAHGEPRCEALYLDLKVRGEQEQQIEPLFDRVRAAWLGGPRRDLAIHILCPDGDVIERVRAAAAELARPRCVDVFCDFELPGSVRTARQLGMPNISIGSEMRRAWPGLLREVGDVVRARESEPGSLETVVVWTVNLQRHLRRLVDLGVDGIITDEPRVLRRVWQEERARAKDRSHDRPADRARDDRPAGGHSVGEQRPGAAGPS